MCVKTLIWLIRITCNRPSVEDLPSLDEELYRNLMVLKNYTGDVEDLALNFTLVSDEFGETKVIELIPGGKDIAVTASNRIRYIYLVANYKLNVQIARQSRAFLRGLSDLIHYSWLQMFNQVKRESVDVCDGFGRHHYLLGFQQELHVLVSGADRPLDVDDLARNVEYSGGYDAEHPVILNFWRVVRALSTEDKSKLLKFVTSCSRPPLLGFKELMPKLGIRNTGGADIERVGEGVTRS